MNKVNAPVTEDQPQPIKRSSKKTDKNQLASMAELENVITELRNDMLFQSIEMKDMRDQIERYELENK